MRAIDKHDANAAERQTTPVTVALPPEQCANCLGPHAADQAACPARPKRDHGLLVPREQGAMIRQMGSRLFQQRQAAQRRQQSQTEPSSQPALEAVAEQQLAPVAVMELPQEHVNPQALANVFTCTLPVLPSSSPMRPRAVELGPEAAPRRPLPTSPKRRRANTNRSSP